MTKLQGEQETLAGRPPIASTALAAKWLSRPHSHIVDGEGGQRGRREGEES